MNKTVLTITGSILLFLLSCEQKVTQKDKFDPEKYSTHLYTLHVPGETTYGGASASQISKIIKEQELITEFTGKTYEEVIPIVVEKYKQQEEQKKAEKLAQKKNRKEEKEAAKKRIKTLEKKFNKKVDEFNSIGWYNHKSWGNNWLNRKGLTADVSTTGNCYLVSNYYGDDWLFHTKIKVIVGDTKYESQEIKRFEDQNKSDNSGGNVWEIIQFTKKRDNGILKAIANNADKKIKVRFVGKDFYDEITLSPKDKNAIKDCYELSNIIKTLK